MILSLLGRLFKRSSVLRFLLIPLAFGLVYSLVMVSTCVLNRDPYLESIDPPIAQSGEVLILRGSHFGNSAEKGWIEIAGNRISATAYIQWSDNTILMQIPEQVKDGLVYVHNGRGKSNPRIFANKNNIPVETVITVDTGLPVINAIDNPRPEIGKQLTISGRNFGISRNSSSVTFSWANEPAIPLGPGTQLRDFSVSCSESDFDYEFWSDKEIRIRVPDGAANGTIQVHTERGISNAFAVQPVSPPGTKRYGKPATYVLSQQIDITGVSASEGNILFLFLPLPLSTPSQRNVQVTASSPRPYIENYKGSILHQIENIRSGRNEKVSHSLMLTNYEVISDIKPALVRPYADLGSPLYTTYTAADYLVPADDPAVIKRSAEIVGRERNPYLKARLIYNTLIDNFTIPPLSDDNRLPVESLTSGTADIYERVILFCALARAAGIPALPVSGILVDENRSSRIHWWAEFYIEGFGWVPVDPGAAAGMTGAEADSNSRTWNFGNLDNRHIAFSRGWIEQKPMSPNSKIVYRSRSYALQPIWEEAGGNIRSYTSFWGNPVITGIY